MGRIRSDQDVIQDGRKNTLKDTEDLQVTVPLREQVNQKLVKKLDEIGEGQRTVEVWSQANAARQDWLNRQNDLLIEIDNFVDTIRPTSQAWESALHLPVAFTQCRTMHSRLLPAILTDPPAVAKARSAANQDRSVLVESLLKYTLYDWVNAYAGIYSTADDWMWSIITRGSGVLKSRWERKYERFVDVVEKEEVINQFPVIDPNTGEQVNIPQTKKVEREEWVTEEVCNGPAADSIQLEDIVIVGGGGDPQKADDVIQSEFLTAGELWTLADTGIFIEDAVTEVIKSGENYQAGEVANAIKVTASENAGTPDLDKEFDQKRYQILERYARIDVTDSGIPSEVILWVHKETKRILRATYLRRVSVKGIRPYFKADFHRRPNQDWGVGLPELIYSLSKEIDAIHNMRMDFGLISSMPFGYYRASSSMTEEKIPIEPGALIPLDNPTQDVYFPNLGNRTTFTVQEEGMLQQWVERTTSLSDLNLGLISGQGATRTATGTRTLIGESSQNMDVLLRRIITPWRQFLRYLFHQVREKLPPGFTFRVFGDDGQLYFETIEDKKAIEGEWDFDIDANSANSNKQLQLEQANQIYQLTGNPLDYQLGIFTPAERYEAIKNLLQVMGVRDVGRFVRKPQGAMRVFTPEEIANAVLAGVDIKLGPEQDLQGFLEYFQHILDHDEILGQYNEQQTLTLAAKAQEAEAMLQAVKAQQAQMQNQAQMQMNASMATPTPQGAASAQQAQAAPSAQAPAAAGE